MASPTAETCDNRRLELVKTIFETLTAALKDNLFNKEVFSSEVRYDMLVDSLRVSNVIADTHSEDVFQYLLCMAGEFFGREHDLQVLEIVQVVNPHAVRVLVSLLPQAPLNVQEVMLTRLATLCRREFNAQTVSSRGVIGMLLEKYATVLTNPQGSLYTLVLDLVKQLGQHCLTAAELRAFLRVPLLCTSLESLAAVFGEHLRALVAMTKGAAATTECNMGWSCPPFMEFDMSKGFACLFVPSIARLPRAGMANERMWPPGNGFTTTMWVCVKEYGADHPVRLLTLFSPSEPEIMFFSLEVDPSTNLIVAKTIETVMFRFKVKRNVWYHFAFVFNGRLKLKNSQLVLYVDGKHVDTVRLPYPTTGPSQAALMDVQSLVCGRIGSSVKERKVSSLCFRVAACYLIDEALPASTIAVIYQLGPLYAGNFQGLLTPWQAWSHSFTIPLMRAAATEGGASTPAPRASAAAVPPTSGNASAIVNLATLAIPLISEEKIWLSLHAHTNMLVVCDTAMEVMGGRVASRAFCRETDTRDRKSLIPSLRNAVATSPPFGHFSGAARPFALSGVSATLDQV